MLTKILRSANGKTKIQYALMAVLGGLCVIFSFAPLDISTATRVGIVGILFGVTVGLWVSHLIQILSLAAESDES
jgi:hypothetical protein